MNTQELVKELQAYYWNEVDALADALREKCEAILDAMHPNPLAEGNNAHTLKEDQYRVIAENFTPKLFHNSPFYYDMSSMWSRCDGACNSRGHIHCGAWLHRRRHDLCIDQDPEMAERFFAQKKELLYNVCGTYIDEYQHYGFNYRPIFETGMKGIYERAKAGLETAETQKEYAFLHSVCEGLLSVKRISERFGEEAEKRLQTATDAGEIFRLKRIATSAKRTPWEAPQTFYEALNTLAFFRKVIGTLEGVGVNTFGRVDMDLYPFYERDLQNGTLTKEEAYELIVAFLLTWDCHYDHDMKMVGYSDHELENTYTLGGCDAQGKPVYNELTDMFLQATREYKIIYPKIKCRISASSPKAYLDAINRDVINGTSSVMYSNDDAMIPAIVRSGKPLEEARDYIESGCWDIVLLGKEKSDCGGYFNALKVFEFILHNRQDKMQTVGLQFDLFDGATSFEALYQTFLDGIKKLLTDRNRIMKKGRIIHDQINPLPIFSSTLDDCIAKKRDSKSGGGRYNDDKLYIIGLPNIVDSLIAIKQLCFEQKKYTLDEMLAAVRANWDGYEHIRRDALKCPCWGDESQTSNAMARRFNDDLYALCRQLDYVYGGKTELGHLTYTEIKWWGLQTLATPDGRYSGDYFSQGLTPSRLRKIPAVTSVLNSMKAIDTSTMYGNSVMNIILPSTRMSLDVAEGFLRALCQCGVQSLQLNCTTKEQLLDAQKHPENYPNLIVRVCGFSAKFTALSPEWQDEILTRNFYD